MSTFLELRAAYKKNIQEMQEMLIPDKDNEFIELTSNQIIKRHLHNQRIKTCLSNLRLSYQHLGVRIGEIIDEKWLKGLNELERSIFVDRFSKKMGYKEIALTYNVSSDDAKEIFEKSLNTVLKNL